MLVQYARSLMLCVVFCMSLAPAGLAQTAPPAPSTPPAAAAPTPPVPVPFDDALVNAANDLFSKATLNGQLDLVIDPLIDGASGGQSVATRLMNRRLVELVNKNYPRFKVQPFNSAAVANKPVVLIGTFTAINNAGTAGAPKDAFRICLALADLKSQKIISKGVARAKPEGIDTRPTPFFNDQPVFTQDAAVDSYIKSCQTTRPGDAILPAYVERIASAALVSDAIDAYNDRRYEQARLLYAAASQAPGGAQLRVYNGLYLTNWKLNRTKEAAEAFGKTVDYGLASNRIAVRFLFRPGSPSFRENRETSAAYQLWLTEIAKRASASQSCFETVGHTSPTGLAPLNQRLSLLRAEYVRDRMINIAAGLSKRMISSGMASKENLVGTGRDDESDALDRRVEIKVLSPNCGV